MPRHLAFPFAVTASGPLAALAQDSDAEIGQSVGILLATPVGDRRCVPGYGLPDPLGRGADVDTIAQTVSAWEPRADAVAVAVSVTNARGEQTATVALA
ncbi:hypothetical protein GCM10022215_17950 [Nocardioides fonticola]|uniref:IraD/Gp25-like domain-containing protein n=1 Tax=Nocardioides fonticola TaxID=450363 RepID=A0ABP7XIC4_9ACTN